ncbi:MAG: MBL fold metallo-hydrolase [Thermodesulfobacteriota bacterium]
MKITFHGAAREVTGSMHLLQTDHDNVLLDCGLFQGRRSESSRKNRTAPFDPAILTNIVLSHAHIDHCGRIPMMVKEKFNGRIICTRATKDVCDYMLTDAAHIQESEAEYLNYKAVRNAIRTNFFKKQGREASFQEIKDATRLLKREGARLDAEQINALAARLYVPLADPLYTVADAASALQHFEGIPYRTPVDIGKDMTVTFYEAGHILGSAVSIIKLRDKGVRKTICFTGDLGRFGKAIIRDPNLDFAPEDRDIDLLIIESTYGDREHGSVADLPGRMKQVLSETLDRNGTVIIPAFAYGRTQEILYTVHALYDRGDVKPVAVYVDSPLASKLTRVFSEHPEVYDCETHETFLKRGDNPFDFDMVHFVESVEESMEVMKEKIPHIVISASGMCEFGRILHHLRYKIHNPANTILIVGYMAENTLGRRILVEGEKYQRSGKKTDPPIMKIFGKEYPLKAHVTEIDGFSAHADKHELTRFIRESNLNIKKAAIVHGEMEQARPFSEELQRMGIETTIPAMGETIII